MVKYHPTVPKRTARRYIPATVPLAAIAHPSHPYIWPIGGSEPSVQPAFYPTHRMGRVNLTAALKGSGDRIGKAFLVKSQFPAITPYVILFANTTLIEQFVP